MPKRMPKKSPRPAVRHNDGEILCPICAMAPLLSNSAEKGTVKCPTGHIMALSKVFKSIPNEHYSNN